MILVRFFSDSFIHSGKNKNQNTRFSCSHSSNMAIKYFGKKVFRSHTFKRHTRLLIPFGVIFCIHTHWLYLCIVKSPSVSPITLKLKKYSENCELIIIDNLPVYFSYFNILKSASQFVRVFE